MSLKSFKHFLFAVVLFVPGLLRAQSVNKADVLNKTWHIVAMKCPDKVANAASDDFIHFYGTITLKQDNVNNMNYGTYERVYRDVRDNPIERGTYAINTSENGNLVLTLTPRKSEDKFEYVIETASEHYLTLIQQGAAEKCNITYAVAP